MFKKNPIQKKQTKMMKTKAHPAKKIIKKAK
jgi:hypothetical protein